MAHATYIGVVGKAPFELELMDEQKEIRVAFRQQQERYVYYLVALSVAAIGFSFYLTNGQPFTLVQIPLGLSVLLWSLSTYFGLRFLKYTTSNLFANYSYFDIIKGVHPIVKDDLSKVPFAKAKMSEIMNDNAKTATKYFTLQEWFFYSAILPFLLWHLYGMYIATNS